MPTLADAVPDPDRGFTDLGGCACLDFVNTKAHRLTDSPDDALTGYLDLVRWAEYSLGPDDAIADAGRRFMVEDSRRATEFQSAIRLREALFRIFSSLAAAGPPASEDLDLLKRSYAGIVARCRLTSSQGRFRFVPDAGDSPLDAILAPVLFSAIDLLDSGEYLQVKQCPGLGDCGCLFLDTSKNHTRRWCSMESCGSRAKMRRLYAKKKRTPPGNGR